MHAGRPRTAGKHSSRSHHVPTPDKISGCGRHEIWAGLAGPVRACVGRRAGCAAGVRPGYVPAFLEHFDLRPAEAARLRDSRRLFALCWLKLLRLQAPPHPRNPPGTVEKQAQRLLELLGC